MKKVAIDFGRNFYEGKTREEYLAEHPGRREWVEEIEERILSSPQEWVAEDVKALCDETDNFGLWEQADGIDEIGTVLDALGYHVSV